MVFFAIHVLPNTSVVCDEIIMINRAQMSQLLVAKCIVACFADVAIFLSEFYF